MNDKPLSSHEIEATQGDMLCKQRKQAVKHDKLSKTDKAIIKVAKLYPEETNYQLGKRLVGLGKSQNPKSIYSRLKKSDYLRGEIDRIRENNHEFMSREIVPEALKIHKKVLRDKTIPALKKKDWVFQAEKAEFKIDQPSQGPRMININIAQQIQAMIRNDVK